MSGLNRAAQRFLTSYRGIYPDAQAASALAREIIERIARETGAIVHVVSGRAKSIESLRGKFRRKTYSRPANQITDLVGVRVITYYRDHVDPVVAAIQQQFDINQRESVDKRLSLGLRDFGYRSVHLIVRLKAGHRFGANYRFLQEHWFEIQVRSILEHAWSEIEHEVVYKSGIVQPHETLRRFAALAGTLELLDQEFLALREERNLLIDRYVEIYRKKAAWRTPFDVARLLGFLEVSRSGRSWREAVSSGQPFGVGLEASCVEALRSAGLSTPASLSAAFRSSRFRYALRTFAALQGIAIDQVSHLASVVLAIASKDASVIRHHFPEILYDPTITQIVDRRLSRRRRAA